MDFRARLQAAFYHLSQTISPLDNLSCLQVWMPASNQLGLDALQKQLYSDPELCIMGSPALMTFRLSSCQSMQYGHQGMPGRVLRSGCVQVVQNLRIIPEVLHPRCRLPEAVSAGVGEVLYIPVFDLHAPHAGPVAVLEALLSATATDSMLVANFISVVGNVLSCLQLSLSNPLPQPVKRSKLEGRKPRPIHHDSSQDLTHAHTQQEQQPVAQQQVPAQPAVQDAHHAVQQPAGATQQSSFAAAACSPADGFCQPEHLPAHQQLQLQLTRSGSSGSAGTIVAGPSAGTPTSSPVDYALDSTVSSRLRDSCPGHASTAPARTSAEFPPAAAAGSMLPPRPCAAGAVRLLQRRRWQQEGDITGADGSEDSDASPPPNKLRRMTEPAHMSSMARTKSVPLGLDQVLLNAIGGCEPAASC